MNLSIKVYDKENHLLKAKTANRPTIENKEVLNIIDNAIERNNILYSENEATQNKPVSSGESYK